jgi:hypothetical protein
VWNAGRVTDINTRRARFNVFIRGIIEKEGALKGAVEKSTYAVKCLDREVTF